MRRREFLGTIGSAAIWPLAARAQDRERVRHIGVLVPAAADDPVWQARFGAFLQALAILGWTIGRNVHLDTRWATPNAAEIRKQAAEIAALAPDIILAGGSSTMEPLLQATRTVPIVFTLGNDPVGSGFVDSLARPGGNATGFMSMEFSMAGKWLELLKEIAPGVTRVAVLRDTGQAFAISLFATMQAVAPPLGVEVIPINMRNAAEIEQSVGTFARSPNGGLIPVSSAAALRHRELILTLAAKAQAAGGLLGPLLRHCRRFDVLWAGSRRSVPPSSRLRRPDPQGREAKRPAGAGADQVRAGDQPQDRQDTWSRSAARHARPRRRGGRMT